MAKNGKGMVTLRRIQGREELFDLFRQVTEKIREDKNSSSRKR